MKQVLEQKLPQVSNRRLARVLGFDRNRLSATRLTTSLHRPKRRRAIDTGLAERIRELIQTHPSFGYRRIWALLRFKDGIRVNRKKVQRIMQLKRWQCTKRKHTAHPRVKRRRSQSSYSNERWAMDVTHIDCGRDGWGHLVAVIDCHDRQIVGYEFALRGRAKEAERALEMACLSRFGTLRPAGATPVIRSDNGLIFQSRRFRKACRFYRLKQEYITPYTPQQNGLIKRFFRSLKEECVWQHRFASFAEARATVVRWLQWYNDQRPHQALRYLSPSLYRQQLKQVA